MPCLEHLVAIDVGVDLRHRGAERRVDAGELGPLARRGEELLQRRRSRCSIDAAADRSCSQNVKPPCEPRPGIDGGMTANAAASGISCRNLRVQPVDDRARVQRRLVALVPRLQADEVEAVVRRRDARQQAEADDGVEGADALRSCASIASTLRQTSSVRCSDAAGGSCTFSRK